MAARAKLSPKKQQALEALMEHPGLAEAARAAGITLPVMQRLIAKDREFGEALRAANKAAHRQSARRLGQGFALAVKSTVDLMYHGKRPMTRLQAARDIRSLAKEGIEFEDFAAAVADAERLLEMNRAGSLPAGKRGKPGIGAHGAKYPRIEEKAITALLTERSVAAAARSAGITPQTLHKWMELPVFLARLAAAAAAVFAEGMMLALRREDDAVIIIRSMTGIPSTPEQTRLQANRYTTRDARAQAIEDLDTRTADMEDAVGSAGERESDQRWKILGRTFYQRLKRIKASVSSASCEDDLGFEFVHAEDGKPTGLTSVPGPDAGQIWVVPPTGSKAGDPVPDPGWPHA